VTVHLWRIATETMDYRATDATGAGARFGGGRWNHQGIAVVYSAPSIALAALETIVHLRSATLPLNRYLISVEVPDEVWARRMVVDKDTAPRGWDAEPVGLSSLEFGDRWVKSEASALLVVPSVVIPLEHNVLINPAHSDASGLVFSNTGKFVFDERIRAS